ncbi:MAG TPA: alpha/beta fold hydrolase [Dehalococcoidia bacterium]|nr:alpha/beta fold hydrolase [Dehalococcoidia bacterium]
MPARTLLPLDPDAVAPWRLGDGPRAALLLHGFAGTPPELRRLGEHLAERGWRCVAPALPGHATTPEDLRRFGWRDWAGAALAAFDSLAAQSEVVVVAGQSMGATLALHVAANDLRVRAVASLAAPLWFRGMLPPLLPVLQYVARWHKPGDDVDLWDPTAVDELHSYGMRSVRAINQLQRLVRHVRSELAQVRAPVLVVHGLRDRTVDPGCAVEIQRRLVCSDEVEALFLPRSGHAVSVDVDREQVNERVAQWFERHTAAARRRQVAAG